MLALGKKSPEVSLRTVDFRPRQSYIVRSCLKITNKLNEQINRAGEMVQRRTWVPSSQWLPTTVCKHNSRGSDPHVFPETMLSGVDSPLYSRREGLRKYPRT